MRLRILIADDHDIMREGTRALIERQPGWKVCGITATGAEVVKQATALAPDIVVMDVTKPELKALDTATQIKRRLPDTEIVIFTAHQSQELIQGAFAAGVKSFIDKAPAHTDLIEAIETASRHKPFFTEKVSEVLFSNMVNRPDGPAERPKPGAQLSARERVIAQLLAEGKSNKEVAQALGISVRTAETHRASILRKLELNSVVDLVRYAIRNKLIEL